MRFTKKQILFHVDAAQSTGKVPINLQALKVDLMSFSAHKTYGPKGIGALYVRRKPRVRIEAQIHGGGHERGFRSGTLPTHEIAGFGAAAKLASDRWEEDQAHYASLGGYMTQRLLGLEGALVLKVPQHASLQHEPPVLPLARQKALLLQPALRHCKLTHNVATSYSLRT